MNIRVATWNINAGKDINGIIAYIRAINPDVIALQEVVEGHRNAGGQNIANLIAKSIPDCGYQVAWYPAFKTDRHFPSYEYGDAILSRFPIVDSKRHFLSDLTQYKKTRETEPRIAIEALVDIGGKTLRVFNTHLAVSGDFSPLDLRHQQVDTLEGLIGTGKVNKTICLGDFNASNDPYISERMSVSLRNADNEPTAGTWPVQIDSARIHKEHSANARQEFEMRSQRLDHIFVSPDIIVAQFEIGQSNVSDHLPLIAELAV